MQQGSIIQTGCKQGPNVWSFRWSEKNRNGRRVYRKRVIGTIQQYPDAQAARAATGALLARPLGANRRRFQAQPCVQDHCYADLRAF